MTLSVFISRAALSITCILFVLTTVVHKDAVKQLQRFLATPFLLFFSLLFFIPFLSGLWSSDLEKWVDVVRLKLPLLFFPLAFAGDWKLATKQWRMIAWFFLVLIFSGSAYGLADYLFHAKEINESYLRAKTILTPLEDDHVRFSWLVSVGVILCFVFIHHATLVKTKLLCLLLALFFAVYLHVLSARTGLLCLYLFLFLLASWMYVKNKSLKTVVLTLLTIFALPTLAYLFLPTFQARLRYNFYDLSFVKKNEYLPRSSDGARTMSLKAGWQVLKENPFGAGAGDVMTEADKWYMKNVPQVLAEDKSYPSSEWLMYGGFAGWIGVLIFTINMLLPFLIRPKIYQVYWIGLSATAAFSFMFDMGLEVQFGIFLYAFIILWWWKWFAQMNISGTKQRLSDQ